MARNKKISYNLLNNEDRNQIDAYWTKQLAEGHEKRDVCGVSLADDSDDRYCFNIDGEVVYLTDDENKQAKSFYTGLRLLQVDNGVYEVTRELTRLQAYEFEKWFDFHINTDYERNDMDDNKFVFTLFDIEEKSEVKLLESLDVVHLEEKERAVVKLKDSDEVFVSQWVSPLEVEDLRIKIVSRLGPLNFEFRFDESEYDIHKKLDGTIVSKNAVVVEFNKDDVLVRADGSGEVKVNNGLIDGYILDKDVPVDAGTEQNTTL